MNEATPNHDNVPKRTRQKRGFAAGPQGEMARSVLAAEIRYGRTRYRDIGGRVLRPQIEGEPPKDA